MQQSSGSIIFDQEFASSAKQQIKILIKYNANNLEETKVERTGQLIKFAEQ